MTHRLIIQIVVTALFCLLPLAALAGTVQIPQTGQTTCYDSSGNVIACTGTGQDGAIQAGTAWPSPRFTDNSNGTVTDNLTGLIWLKNANCFGSQIWSTAVASANSLASGQCGLTDGSTAGQWRLPNMLELRSLVNEQQSSLDGWLNTQGFLGVQAYYYWSSSTFAFSAGSAWVVGMDYGGVSRGYKADVYYVWPVRSGQ